jgi:hypothetical protein
MYERYAGSASQGTCQLRQGAPVFKAKVSAHAMKKGGPQAAFEKNTV